MTFWHIGPRRTPHEVLRLLLHIFAGVECILAGIIMVLGSVTAHELSRGLYSGTPGKLVYNIFIAAFTFVALLIATPLDVKGWCTIRKQKYTQSLWPRVAINVGWTVVWIAATACAFFYCSDLCPYAPGGLSISYAGFCCDCTSSGNQDEFCVFFVPSREGAVNDTYTYPATKGLDILLLLLFAVSTGLAASFFWVREDPSWQRDREQDSHQASTTLGPGASSYGDREYVKEQREQNAVQSFR